MLLRRFRRNKRPQTRRPVHRRPAPRGTSGTASRRLRRYVPLVGGLASDSDARYWRPEHAYERPFWASTRAAARVSGPELGVYPVRTGFVVGSEPNTQSSAPRGRMAQFFGVPRQVAVCVRRAERREVLHARGVAGRSGQRTPSYSWRSSVRCR